MYIWSINLPQKNQEYTADSWIPWELGGSTLDAAENKHIILQSALWIRGFTLVDATNHTLCSTAAQIYRKKSAPKWTQTCAIQGSPVQRERTVL